MISHRIFRNLLLAVMVITISSCGGGKLYEKYTDIENYRWQRDQPVSFSVNIKDVSTPCDVLLCIRHSSAYPYANILIAMRMTTPSGEVRNRDYNFQLRNTDGSFLADGMGDLWDITLPLYEKISLQESGTYNIEIQNIMPYVYTDDIMQVGLIIKKSAN